MIYSECVEYILSIPRFADKLGLDNLNRILSIMGHPERCYPIIHVAGTNGKGSTCAFLSSVMREKGAKVGMFTSPHLIRLNERITIDGDPISDDDFVNVFEEVSDIVKTAKKEGIAHPSFFEFVFLMCVLFFQKKNVDYAILETGMGGRLDATNVVKPVLSIITSIGMDHMQYLGDTLEQIAEEKAGIIKHDVPLVFFDRKDISTVIISKKCAEVGAFLHIVEKKQCNLLKITKKSIDFSFQSDYYRYDSLKIKKTALYQIENAALAVKAYELLSTMNFRRSNNCDFIHKDFEAIRTGLWNMEWFGRMQMISDRIYVDGAHNEEAIQAFCHTLEVMFPNEHKVLLFAVSKDKDYKKMIELLCRISFDEIIIVRYEGDRSAGLDIVESTFKEYNRNLSDCMITCFEDIKTGFEYAKAHVENRLLFCVGSLYLVGDLLNIQE